MGKKILKENMFDAIQNSFEIIASPKKRKTDFTTAEDKNGDNKYEIKKYILYPSYSLIKSSILEKLQNAKDYHDEEKLTKDHIKNLFNKKYGWYINKEIMNWLDELGHIKKDT